MRPLYARELLTDPRIAQAKELMLTALREHQKKITSIRPPDPDLIPDYEALLAQLGQLRAAKTYFPFLGSGIGNGALVELLDGSVKYDLISGIGVHHFGHSHPDLVGACIDSALSDTVMEGNLQQNADALDFTNDLVKASGFAHCFLSSSGAMANENALKLAFQRHAPANRILAFEHCFAGRTWALSQITDKPAYRQGLPIHLQVDYIPFFDATRPEESTEATIRTIRQHVTRYPKQHAMLMCELIQGEGGFYPGSAKFFRQVMSFCKEHHISIFVDEIQTFGRLPTLFAFQYFQIQDLVDIVSIGKLSQVCATLFAKDYHPQAGLLSQTFTASTAAIRAGRVILRHLLEKGYLGEDGKIVQLGSHFRNKLEAVAQRHPGLLKGPYGVGAMVAFTPFDGEAQRVARFVHKLFHAGVIGFIAGAAPTRVRFLLPVGALTFEDIDVVTDVIENVLIGMVDEPISNPS